MIGPTQHSQIIFKSFQSIQSFLQNLLLFVRRKIKSDLEDQNVSENFRQFWGVGGKTVFHDLRFSQVKNLFNREHMSGRT